MRVHSAFWCLFHFFRNKRFGRIRLKSGSNSDLIQDIQGIITSRKIKLVVASRTVLKDNFNGVDIKKLINIYAKKINEKIFLVYRLLALTFKMWQTFIWILCVRLTLFTFIFNYWAKSECKLLCKSRGKGYNVLTKRAVNFHWKKWFRV